jgi:hypothetical protein
MTTTLDLDDLRTHIGRTQIATDLIHAGPANFLRLALGRPDPEFSRRRRAAAGVARALFSAQGCVGRAAA